MAIGRQQRNRQQVAQSYNLTSPKRKRKKSHLLHNRQGIPSHSRHDRRKRSNTHQSKLKERVVLADGRGVDLCRGK